MADDDENVDDDDDVTFGNVDGRRMASMLAPSSRTSGSIHNDCCRLHGFSFGCSIPIDDHVRRRPRCCTSIDGTGTFPDIVSWFSVTPVVSVDNDSLDHFDSDSSDDDVDDIITNWRDVQSMGTGGYVNEHQWYDFM